MGHKSGRNSRQLIIKQGKVERKRGKTNFGMFGEEKYLSDLTGNSQMKATTQDRKNGENLIESCRREF